MTRNTLIIIVTLIIVGGFVGCVALVPDSSEDASVPQVETYQTPTLTSEEQGAYDHIRTNLPKLNALLERFGQACSSLDFDGVVDCAGELVELNEEWVAVDVAGGQVAALEYAYDEAIKATRDLMLDVGDIMDGDPPSDAQIDRHVERAVDSLSACERALDDIDTTY